MTKCLLCEGESLASIPEVSRLVGVTSDCKPWPRTGSLAVCASCGHIQKQLNELWFSDVQTIYQNYRMYPLSDGNEQVVFADSTALPRTLRLLERLQEHVEIPSEGSLLDIGCGNGSLLRSFGQKYPLWRLFGFEQNAANRHTVLAIDGVEDFYSGSLDEVADTFDIVAMIHVIEHLPNPVTFIKTLGRLLKPDGVLVIQTTDFAKNPFDVLVADHCSHFQTATLAYAAESAGFESEIIADDWIPKEITLVARRSKAGAQSKPSDSSEKGRRVAEEAVSWLRAVVGHARNVAEEGVFGIFGTALAGTWLASALDGTVDFFVDEDPLRQGKSHLALAVLKPDDVPEEASVYVAFPPGLGASLVRRLHSVYRHIRFVLPPDVQSSGA